MVCVYVPISREKTSFGITGTVNCLLACDHANIPSPCIWVNLPLTLLTRWKLDILSNSNPLRTQVCAILRIFYGKIYITFQLLQIIINNYVRVRVLVDFSNHEPTPTLIFLIDIFPTQVAP